MAAVSVVLPWSTCPMVPTFTLGLVSSPEQFLTWRVTQAGRVTARPPEREEDSLGTRVVARLQGSLILVLPQSRTGVLEHWRSGTLMVRNTGGLAH